MPLTSTKPYCPIPILGVGGGRPAARPVKPTFSGVTPLDSLSLHSRCGESRALQRPGAGERALGAKAGQAWPGVARAHRAAVLLFWPPCLGPSPGRPRRNISVKLFAEVFPPPQKIKIKIIIFPNVNEEREGACVKRFGPRKAFYKWRAYPSKGENVLLSGKR